MLNTELINIFRILLNKIFFVSNASDFTNVWVLNLIMIYRNLRNSEETILKLRSHVWTNCATNDNDIIKRRINMDKSVLSVLAGRCPIIRWLWQSKHFLNYQQVRPIRPPVTVVFFVDVGLLVAYITKRNNIFLLRGTREKC